MSNEDNTSILLKQKKDNRCNIYAENARCLAMKGYSCERTRKDTRIGPVLNIKVCYRDDRYIIEVQVPSLFQDNTVSWVRIAKEEDTASVKTIAKAGSRQKPTVTLTSVSFPVLERKWIDIETQGYPIATS